LLKQAGCSECERLWNDYGQATRSEFALESKLQIALMAQESESVTRLQSESQQAIALRRTLREQILAHVAEVHEQAESAGAAQA
jgi:hypothetical protein